jgi:hypothetical protein
MRRFLVLTCVTAMLGLLVAVAPAVVRPDANRAEANVTCDIVAQTVAQHANWAAKVLLCVEVLGSGVRPGVKVFCGTASTQVPCNWDFNPLHLHNQRHTVIREGRVHETGKTNGAYLATPTWANRSQCTSAYSDSPQLWVRFPDGSLAGPQTATWQAGYFVGC